MEDALVKPETLAEMVAKYEQSLRDINALQPYYEKAAHHLKSGYRSYDKVDFKYTLECLKKEAWNEVFHKTNLYQLMSIAESEKIKKSLYNRDSCEDIKVPDFTFENVMAFIEAKTQDMPNMIRGKIEEVYKILRPRNYYQLKTNETSLFEGVGKKVILSHFFESNYSGGLRICYHKEQELNAIQEIFWLLDGKGVPHDAEKLYHKLYKAERGDAYEDEYFRIKGYSNGNMHLEFKRMDLVSKVISAVKERLLGRVA